jgi:hypothetical protein
MSLPQTIVTFLWSPPRGYRSQFRPNHVNILYRMCKRHCDWDFRFVCVTDQTEGFDEGIDLLTLWPDHGELPSPWGPGGPSCYRRLKMFDPEIEGVLGKRFVALDLDCILLDSMLPLWDTNKEFKIWGQTTIGNHYNGSMMLMTAGARPQVWSDFNPKESPALVKRGGFRGSDQGWISFKLGRGEPTWDIKDGVLSYRLQMLKYRPLPPNARIVFFHGRVDPWHGEAQRLAWVKEHYR